MGLAQDAVRGVFKPLSSVLEPVNTPDPETPYLSLRNVCGGPLWVTDEEYWGLVESFRRLGLNINGMKLYGGR